MAIGGNSSSRIRRLEQNAENKAKEELRYLRKTDEELSNLIQELEKADQLDRQIINQEESANTELSRKKRVKLDKEIHKDVEDALEKIVDSKHRIDDIIGAFESSKEFVVVAGFAPEIGMSNNDDEHLKEIAQALKDELGKKVTMEWLEEVASIESRLKDDLIEARKDLRSGVAELKEAMGYEKNHLEVEDVKKLAEEEKQEVQFIEDVIEHIGHDLVNLDRSIEEVDSNSTSEHHSLDKFYGTLAQLEALIEYEEVNLQKN